MRTVMATRYVTPLREGGSLPAIVEAADDGMYGLTFRGAGQGPNALMAECVAGEIVRALGLLVPEIVFVELDPILARTEPDPDIQDLIRASAGLNLALDSLPSAVTFDPVTDQPEAELASAVVWFDAYVTNVDRTPRHTNLRMWHRRLWLMDHGMDHGAALSFHHTWQDYLPRSRAPFPLIKDHVLLPCASALHEVDAPLTERLTPSLLASIVPRIPDAWLVGDAPFGSGDQHREASLAYLLRRLAPPRAFLEEALRARSLSV